MNLKFNKKKLKLCLLINLEKKYTDEVINYLMNNYDVFIISSEKKTNLQKIQSMNFDILISYIYPYVVPKNILDKTRLFNVNFHPGPPQYPGIGCFNFALFNEENKYGVTAHDMKSKVDTGEIIKVKNFSIKKNMTVEELSLKTYKNLFFLLKDVIQKFQKENKISYLKTKWSRKPYTRKHLNKLSKLTMNMDKKNFLKTIRCTYYKDKPPPYIILHGRKFIYEE